MHNEPEDYEYEPSELESGIMLLVKNEVDKQVASFKEEYNWYKEKYDEYNQKYLRIHYENEELNKHLQQFEVFKVFKNLINEENFEGFLSLTALKDTGIRIDGMYSETIPLWFKLLIRYYDDKNTLITLMDLFEIKYEKWIHTYKMPYEYNESEVDYFFDDLKNRYITNGCNFEGNMGFFWQSIMGVKGDTIQNMNKRAFSSYVPWQLFLRNPLLKTDKFFNRILESLKNNVTNSYYFFRIQEYQDITQEQVLSMIGSLPLNNMQESHKKFIENNKNIIKLKPEIANKFKDKINDNHYSTFYFLNYPKHMQISFVTNNKDNYRSKFDLVKKMEISKEEKIKLLSDIAEAML